MNFDIPLDHRLQTNYIGYLHSYIRNSLLLIELATIDEASVKAMHLESKGEHEQNDCQKRAAIAKIRGAKPSSTHCDKEGHDEENCWKLHRELRPKRNDRNERHKTSATMQRDHEPKSKTYEKVIAAGFTHGRPIDQRLDFGDKKKFTTLGIAAYGPIDLGSDSGNETKIIEDEKNTKCGMALGT